MGRTYRAVYQGFISRRGFHCPPQPNLVVVEIIKFMWDTSYIPTELVWTVLLLIPMVNSDTWGIGLIEVVWKVVWGGDQRSY